MKELIPWNDKFSLGIEEIDIQHKKMIEIINRLYRSMQTSTEKDAMNTILQELHDYADYHFATEEKHFEEFNYKDKVEHTKSHNAYREKIAQFSKENNNNEVMASFQLMDFLGEWWTGHILGEDRKYIECFHENGLK